MSDLSQWGYASWWFWNQVGAQIGIESINSDPAVLPNTTIRIKRFNNYCSPVKRGSCGGLAMKVAQDISNDHPDVVAVFGDFFGSTTIFSAEVFSKARLPFCGGTQLNKALLNKNNYPYFMQTMASAGRGDAIVKLLQMWKVQRVGILFTKEVRGSRSECASVYNALVASNIDILSIMESVSVTDAEYIGEQFNIVGVRYIIACDAGESLFTMYMALTKTAKKLVGPGYVWISLGTLTQTAIKGNLDKKYGADFFKHAEGFVSIGGGMMSSAKMYSRQEQLLKAIQDIQSPWGFGMEHLTGWFNGVAAFDCVGLLGYGLDKLLRKQGDASLKLLLSGELQTQMNHSLFSDTGYQGVSADPLKLTPYGDLATPFFFYYTNGSTPALKTRVFAVTNIELTDIHYVQNAPLFYGGGNLPPPDGPQAPEVSILFGSVLSAGFIILAGFGMAFSAGLLGLVYLNHDHDVIRTGSPLYLTLICLGSILRYSSILLHIGQYSRKVKQYQFVFESISLVVVVAACLIRNLKVYILYSYQSNLSNSIYLKELFWFGMFSTVVAIEAIMLAFVWQFFGMNRTIPQRGISIIGNKSMVMIIAIHMFHVLLFLGLFVLGCLTRNISSQHNESVLLVTFATCWMAWTVYPNYDYPRRLRFLAFEVFFSCDSLDSHNNTDIGAFHSKAICYKSASEMGELCAAVTEEYEVESNNS
ncbi:periplasmic binding protein-like I [Obelidium mucronatum]|nr:periplasmic binding protein-like I [Obelidium mucronatum]